MPKKTKPTNGKPILIALPLKEDSELRKTARAKGLTPTSAARLILIEALAAASL